MSHPADTDRPFPPGDPSAAAPPRRRRWLGIALIVSVCVNLLVVGLGVGFAWRAMGPRMVEMPAGFDSAAIWRVAHALDGEDRDAARRVVDQELPRFRELQERKLAARRAIAARLVETPFSPDALRAALVEARAREKEGRDLIDEAFVRFAGQLDAPARAAIAEVLRRPPHRTWDHHGAD